MYQPLSELFMKWICPRLLSIDRLKLQQMADRQELRGIAANERHLRLYLFIEDRAGPPRANKMAIW